MANFISIFTIENGTDQDYINLKRLLEKAGFSKIIKSETGITYWLPPHTYFATSTKDKNHVLDVGINVIRRLRKRYSAFVSESAGSTWVGLAHV